jgi:hypothetical protein
MLIAVNCWDGECVKRTMRLMHLGKSLIHKHNKNNVFERVLKNRCRKNATNAEITV